MNIKVNKSYFLIDTPEECSQCKLPYMVDYDHLVCPLLGENVTSIDPSYKHEKCPLKTITVEADIEV